MRVGDNDQFHRKNSPLKLENWQVLGQNLPVSQISIRAGRGDEVSAGVGPFSRVKQNTFPRQALGQDQPQTSILGAHA